MSINLTFQDLWEKTLHEYFTITDRTYSEQNLLKQLKSPEDLQNQLETDQEKFHDFRAKHSSLTGRLKATVQPFIVLSDIASSVISLSPFAPVSTILGAVIFVVKAANGVSQAYEWIETLFDKLGDFTVRLNEYVIGTVSEHLKTKVIQILGCLLEILARSEKTIRNGRWKTYAAVLFLGQDEKVKASFEKLAKLFEDEQRLVVAITYATNQRMDKKIEEIENTGKQSLEAEKRIERRVDAIRQSQQDCHRDAILDWISSSRFSTQQSDFIARREEGTGSWFLHEPEFKEWIYGSSQTLFCPGMPGAGKTIVAAVVIDHIANTVQNDGNGLAYIFCNYKEQGEQKASILLAAILRQLVQARRSIPATVSQLHNHHITRGTTPSPQEIFRTLLSILEDYSRVYVVIDALDECLDSQLLIKIRHLQTKARTDLHLMATSRFIPEIEQNFAGALRLEIRASENDVRTFVASQMYRLPDFVQDDVELPGIVQDIITQAVDGMFLLAHLYIESLLDKNTKKEVKSALRLFKENQEKLDKVYDKAYTDALRRIDAQLPGKRRLAKKVLSWITYAERPLTPGELCHALAIELGKLDEDDILEDESVPSICASLITDSVDQENMPTIKRIVSICAGLVTVDEKTNIVRLVHYTAQKYFERIREIWCTYAQLKIATTCLIYLTLDDFRTGSCPSDDKFQKRLEDNKLLSYAARYWAYHIRTVEEKVSDLALAFLQDANLVSSAVQANSTLAYRGSGYSQRFTKRRTGLHLTAILGLSYLTKRLLSQPDQSRRISADPKDEDGQTPLFCAAVEGHQSIVELLLATGEVDPDSKDEYGRTPLSWAAANGHENVAKLLLATNKVDPDSKDDYERTPLAWAAKNGNKAVVELLLATGKVDLDSKYKYGQTPLSWAASNGHEAVVKLLLTTNKVNPDSQDAYKRTPLSWAAKNGHEAVAKLLLTTGIVHPDVKDEYGQTPLSLAAANGYEAVVQRLLSVDKVDPDSKDNNQRTPLWWAAANGHDAVVQRLLATAKVNPDSTDEYGQTPLWWAKKNKHETIVKLLGPK